MDLSAADTDKTTFNIDTNVDVDELRSKVFGANPDKPEPKPKIDTGGKRSVKELANVFK